MSVLVTGVAGFTRSHVTRTLVQRERHLLAYQRARELRAHSVEHQYGVRRSGLRTFTPGFSVGHGEQNGLLRFVELVEISTDKTVVRQFQKMQAGDILETAVDISTSHRELAYSRGLAIDYALPPDGCRSYFDACDHRKGSH